MLMASPVALVALVLFERRLMKRGGSPLVDLSLSQESGFAIGVAMALLYYMLSAFYLTFSIYLQGGLGLTPLEAGLRTLPFGIVMPSVIKAVIGGIDQRHAGLASGIAISTFQIGAALGVAIIGGIFFSILGTGQELRFYSHAFAVALGCNVMLLMLGACLSLWLPNPRVR